MSVAPESSRPRWRDWRPQWPTGLGFGLRTAGASLLALYIAFLTSMHEPQWAAMTVFIVAQGDRGMSLAKGRNRIAGTLVGAAMAVLLIAMFAQAPELFVIALASWLALCTGIASLLPGFRSYGAVLAGYTATIIAVAASAHPASVFDIAVARSTEIILGIVVEGVVAAVFASDQPLRQLQPKLETYVRQSSALCAGLLRGDAAQADIQRFFAASLQLDDLVQYAAAASQEVASSLGRVRRLTGRTLSQMVAAQSCHDGNMIGRPKRNPLLVLERLLEARAQGQLPRPQQLHALQHHLQQRLQRLIDSPRADSVLERILLLERGLTILRDFQSIQYEHDAFAQARPAGKGRALGRHRDYRLAANNALRVFLAFSLASVFWLYSAWSIGAGVVSIVGVVCAIYATRPNPVVGSLGFLKGASLAALAALLVDITLMPGVDDFTGLVLVFAPVLTLAGMAMRRPATAAIGSSFSIFFIEQVGPVNGGNHSVVELFNGSAGLLLGIAIGAVVFSVFLPDDFHARLQRLRAAVARDIANIARRPRPKRRMQWYGRMADRLRLQFGAPAGAEAEVSQGLGAMLGALTLGACALELAGLEDGSNAAARTRAVLRRLQQLDMPGLQRRALALSQRCAQQARRERGASLSRQWRRATLLRDMALAVRLHGAGMQLHG